MSANPRWMGASVLFVLSILGCGRHEALDMERPEDVLLGKAYKSVRQGFFIWDDVSEERYLFFFEAPSGSTLVETAIVREGSEGGIELYTETFSFAVFRSMLIIYEGSPVTWDFRFVGSLLVLSSGSESFTYTSISTDEMFQRTSTIHELPLPQNLIGVSMSLDFRRRQFIKILDQQKALILERNQSFKGDSCDGIFIGLRNYVAEGNSVLLTDEFANNLSFTLPFSYQTTDLMQQYPLQIQGKLYTDTFYGDRLGTSFDNGTTAVLTLDCYRVGYYNNLDKDYYNVCGQRISFGRMLDTEFGLQVSDAYELLNALTDGQPGAIPAFCN